MAGLQGNVQTDYSPFPLLAVPGQRYKTSSSDEVEDLVASAVCTPGQLLEVDTNGNVRPAQSAAGALQPLVGVCTFKSSHVMKPLSGNSAAQYQIGERVPFVRKGNIYGTWSVTGTTQGIITTPNYVHSTTGAHEQGAFTDAATSATAGFEIDACPAGIKFKRATGSTTVCLVELNLP